MVSNDCVGGIRPFGLYNSFLYCFHNHSSLYLGMIIRCLHVSSYICAMSFCVWIVCVFVLISFSGLHSFIDMYICGITSGGGINLVSLL